MFCWTIFHGRELLAFSSGSTIHIYTTLGEIVHRNTFSDDIRAFDWCQRDGRLAISQKTNVLIYAPKLAIATAPFETSDLSWVVKSKLEASAELFAGEYEQTPVVPSAAAGEGDPSSAAVALETPNYVRWNVPGTRVIVASANKLCLWEDMAKKAPRRDKSTQSWKFERKSESESDVEDWQKTWEMSLHSAMAEIQCSPDNRFFATVGQNASTANVWFIEVHVPKVDPNALNEVEEDPIQKLNCSQLAHPSQVLTLEWRREDVYKRPSAACGVLLTTAVDGVVRIWSESSPAEPMAFFLCAVLTNDSPGGLVKWLDMPHNLSPEKNLVDMAARIKYDDGKPSSQVEKVSTAGGHPLALKPDAMVYNSDPQTEIETQSWVLWLDNMGTIFVYVVQGLTDLPRRTIKTNLSLKLYSAIPNPPVAASPLSKFYDGVCYFDPFYGIGASPYAPAAADTQYAIQFEPSRMTLVLRSATSVDRWQIHSSSDERARLQMSLPCSAPVSSSSPTTTASVIECLCSHPSWPIFVTIDSTGLLTGYVWANSAPAGINALSNDSTNDLPPIAICSIKLPVTVSAGGTRGENDRDNQTFSASFTPLALPFYVLVGVKDSSTVLVVRIGVSELEPITKIRSLAISAPDSPPSKTSVAAGTATAQPAELDSNLPADLMGIECRGLPRTPQLYSVTVVQGPMLVTTPGSASPSSAAQSCPLISTFMIPTALSAPTTPSSKRISLMVAFDRVKGSSALFTVSESASNLAFGFLQRPSDAPEFKLGACSLVSMSANPVAAILSQDAPSSTESVASSAVAVARLFACCHYDPTLAAGSPSASPKRTSTVAALSSAPSSASVGLHPNVITVCDIVMSGARNRMDTWSGDVRPLYRISLSRLRKHLLAAVQADAAGESEAGTTPDQQPEASEAGLGADSSSSSAPQSRKSASQRCGSTHNNNPLLMTSHGAQLVALVFEAYPSRVLVVRAMNTMWAMAATLEVPKPFVSTSAGGADLTTTSMMMSTMSRRTAATGQGGPADNSAAMIAAASIITHVSISGLFGASDDPCSTTSITVATAKGDVHVFRTAFDALELEEQSSLYSINPAMGWRLAQTFQCPPHDVAAAMALITASSGSTKSVSAEQQTENQNDATGTTTTAAMALTAMSGTARVASLSYRANVVGHPMIGVVRTVGPAVSCFPVSIPDFMYRPRLIDYHPVVVVQWLLRGQLETVDKIVQNVLTSLTDYANDSTLKPEDEYRTRLEYDLTAGLNMFGGSDPTPYPDVAAIRSLNVKAQLTAADTASRLRPKASADAAAAAPAKPADKPEEADAAPAAASPSGEGSASSPPAAVTDDGEPAAQTPVGQLIELLSRIALPGLSRAQQMQLVVVLQTFEAHKKSPDALDTPALRYLIQVRLRQHQLYSMSESAKAMAKLSACACAWALQSDTQEGLIDLVTAQTQDCAWNSIRCLGIPLWVKSPATLRLVAEKVTQEQFRVDKDPTQCTLLYVAMGRKSTVSSLWKAKGNERLFEFFCRNFKDPKNQAAAEKNAYAALGKRNFQYAAAFFILADKARTGIEMLIRKDGDWLMGLMVARLLGDKPLLDWLFHELYTFAEHEHNVWLMSIVLWHQKRHHDSIKVLLKGAQLHLMNNREPDLLTVPPLSDKAPVLCDVTAASTASKPSLRSFDPSLYDFCIHAFQHCPQLAHSPRLLNLARAPLLRKTARFYAHAACPARALAYLNLYTKAAEAEVLLDDTAEEGGIDSVTPSGATLLRKGSMSSSKMARSTTTGAAASPVTTTAPAPTPAPAAPSIDSGTFNFFGGGMMGMGMGTGMGAPAPAAPAAPAAAPDSGTFNFFGGGGMGMGMGGMGGMGASPTAPDSGTMNFFGGGAMMGMGMGAPSGGGAPDSGTMNFFGGGMMGMGMMGTPAPAPEPTPAAAPDSGTMNFFGGGGMMGMGMGAPSGGGAPDSGTMNFFGGGMMGMGMSMGSPVTTTTESSASPVGAPDTGTVNFFGAGGMMDMGMGMMGMGMGMMGNPPPLGASSAAPEEAKEEDKADADEETEEDESLGLAEGDEIDPSTAIKPVPTDGEESPKPPKPKKAMAALMDASFATQMIVDFMVLELTTLRDLVLVGTATTTATTTTTTTTTTTAAGQPAATGPSPSPSANEAEAAARLSFDWAAMLSELQSTLNTLKETFGLDLGYVVPFLLRVTSRAALVVPHAMLLEATAAAQLSTTATNSAQTVVQTLSSACHLLSRAARQLTVRRVHRLNEDIARTSTTLFGISIGYHSLWRRWVQLMGAPAMATSTQAKGGTTPQLAPALVSADFQLELQLATLLGLFAAAWVRGNVSLLYAVLKCSQPPPATARSGSDTYLKDLLLTRQKMDNELESSFLVAQSEGRGTVTIDGAAIAALYALLMNAFASRVRTTLLRSANWAPPPASNITTISPVNAPTASTASGTMTPPASSGPSSRALSTLGAALYLAANRSVSALALTVLLHRIQSLRTTQMQSKSGTELAATYQPYPIVQCLACPSISAGLDAPVDGTAGAGGLTAELPSILALLDSCGPLRPTGHPSIQPTIAQLLSRVCLPDECDPSSVLLESSSGAGVGLGGASSVVGSKLPPSSPLRRQTIKTSSMNTSSAAAVADGGGAGDIGFGSPSAENSWTQEESTYKPHEGMLSVWKLCLSSHNTGVKLLTTRWNLLVPMLTGRVPSAPPTLRAAERYVELAAHSAMISAVCIDNSGPGVWLAIATRNGIREINIQQSIKYRRRSDSGTRLLDTESTTWEQALRRFDKEASADDRRNLSAVMSANLSNLSALAAAQELDSPYEEQPSRNNMTNVSAVNVSMGAPTLQTPSIAAAKRGAAAQPWTIATPTSGENLDSSVAAGVLSPTQGAQLPVPPSQRYLAGWGFNPRSVSPSPLRPPQSSSPLGSPMPPGGGGGFPGASPLGMPVSLDALASPSSPIAISAAPDRFGSSGGGGGGGGGGPGGSDGPPINELWFARRQMNLYRRNKTLISSISSIDAPLAAMEDGAGPTGDGTMMDRSAFSQAPAAVMPAMTPSKKKFHLFHQLPRENEESLSVDHDLKIRCLESHPFLPFYLSGGMDGALHMFQFGLPRSIRTYRPPGAQVSHIHFTPDGYKFGMTDYSGSLLLWRFEANPQSTVPFVNMQPHGTIARDFCFLNSGSLIGTLGSSENTYQLRMYDLLLPYQQRLVHEIVTEHQGTCMTYCGRQREIFFATKKGEIGVFDTRQRQVRQTIRAHEKNIKTLSLSANEGYLASGSVLGDIKIWDARTLQPVKAFTNLHPTTKSLGGGALVSTYGVTGAFFTTTHLFSCGADGRVLRRYMGLQ